MIIQIQGIIKLSIKIIYFISIFKIMNILKVDLIPSKKYFKGIILMLNEVK
jgi:hypothetical protein